MAPKKILVVEDEAVTALDLQTTLQRLGYDVPAVVTSGAAAVAAAAGVRPDLILMDITLEGAMSGIEAADEIRRVLAVPVVFLTANIESETMERALRTEPFGYIPKPYTPDALRGAIEVALRLGEDDRRRRRNEERLERLLEYRRVLLDHLAVGVLFARNRTMAWINRSLWTAFGYTREELLGRNVEMLYQNRQGYERVGEEGYASLARGEIYTAEVEMKKKDGSSIWCRLVGQATDPAYPEQASIWLVEDITGRKSADLEREHQLAEREAALAKVKLLQGFIPICATCKKIRDDQGFWQQLEVYIRDHSEAEFTHGICPECTKKFFSA
jgi:PAS domain S-box-containing protein